MTGTLRRFVSPLALICGMFSGPADAQQNPARPIRFIVPFSGVEERNAETGFTIIANSPREFESRFRDAAARWSEVMKAAGIQVA